MIKKTPIRIQVNPIECGAVVLGIILGYYKHNIAMHELNNLVGVSRFGTNARALMRAAGSLGLKAYAQKILVSDLKSTRSLSVLYVDNSHFVVFEGYFWGRFYINDPALGRYSLSAEQLRRRLSGMQIIIEPTARLAKKGGKNFLGNLGNFSSLGIIFGLTSGILLLSLVSVLALSIAESVKYLSIIIFFLIILTCFCAVFIKLFNLKLKNLYAQELSSWLFTQISQSKSSFFTTRPFASFARGLKNLSTLNVNFPKRFIEFFIGSMSVVIIIGLILMYWPFGLLALGLCVLSLLLAREREESDDVTLHSCAQAYEHYDDLSAMGQNEQIINTQITLTARLLAYDKFAYKSSLSFVFLGLALLVVFYWVNLKIQNASLTTLEAYVVLILIIILSFLTGLLVIIMRVPKEAQDQALLNEINDLSVSAHAKHEIRTSKYLVEIIDGEFIYPGETKAILKNFNLVIERSKVYTIQVAPMSGVSTLLKLVGEKLHWTTGEQRVESRQLHTALIDDEADLFENNLLENIRLFDRNISEDQVVFALEQACAVELFYQRPLGLLAPINAHGTNLSGGQKKRLLLARALAHKPDLIILDDFFETLEVELAIKIIKNLRALKISVIFSSQRILEQNLADEIITWSTQL